MVKNVTRKVKKRGAVCLICFKPDDTWFDFLSTFTEYDVYIVIDDNTVDYKKVYSKYKNVHVIQIENEDCLKNGFKKMTITVGKIVCAWDKAMYYFSSLETRYKNVWFFEDDVFFHDEKTLTNIDSKYKNADLISNKMSLSYTSGKKVWHWKKIDIKFPPPYYGTMVCCIRLSKDMLSKIGDYADKYKTLFFLEALFPTLCMKYKLEHKTPAELETISYRKKYNDADMNTHDIYHPVKEYLKHIYYRNMLDQR